jgi:hypothetical protein
MLKVYALLLLFFYLFDCSKKFIEFPNKKSTRLEVDEILWEALFQESPGLDCKVLPTANIAKITCGKNTFLTFLILLTNPSFVSSEIKELYPQLDCFNQLRHAIIKAIPSSFNRQEITLQNKREALSWWKSVKKKGLKVFQMSNFEKIQIPTICWPVVKHLETEKLFLLTNPSVPQYDAPYESFLNFEAYVKNNQRYFGLLGPISEGFSEESFLAISDFNIFTLFFELKALESDYENFKFNQNVVFNIRNFLFPTPKGTYEIAMSLIIHEKIDPKRCFTSLFDLIQLNRPREIKSGTLKIIERLANSGKSGGLRSVKSEMIQVDESNCM